MLSFFKKKETPANEFKFTESENTACFVCDHVMTKTRPILFATHEAEDGYWQFLCGQADHDDSNLKIISLKQATEIDASINDLYEMPLGIGADRKSTNDKWEPFALDPS
ncbi:DUF2185 domain-containing protein [Mucilaginibacter sp.]|uniref:immunity protein Imm33 domain-containing protein n=1 Tax=Mucilaginibacter sp. TaxID=1882438 RepID=UPI0025D1109E|nr:DUF2185 domain-containing protein [Mucilaginibacter sp.]